MSIARFPVTVFVERVPLVNRWVSEQWRIASVEPDRDATKADETAITVIRTERADVSVWRLSGFCAELHRSEAEGYYLNVTAPEPKIFVMCRWAEAEDADSDSPKLRPQLVTVSYDEAARLLDGGERVDATPLPPEILEWMQPFITANYRPEKQRKVRRNELYERDGVVADVNPHEHDK